jgi:hypothetical protein
MVIVGYRRKIEGNHCGREKSKGGIWVAWHKIRYRGEI